MTDAAPPGTPVGEVSAQARKAIVFGVTVDLILAALTFFLGILAQANSPTGKGAWLETLIVLAVTLGAAGIGWSLYASRRIAIHWIQLIVWSPIPLGILAVLISIALGY